MQFKTSFGLLVLQIFTIGALASPQPVTGDAKTLRCKVGVASRTNRTVLLHSTAVARSTPSSVDSAAHPVSSASRRFEPQR
ncbi:hypothetical protein BJ165DRAFT_1531985 [Panaeolus papilionaceus]|nr:hypothetical protein BJ165DRAFT_1531985 [Panaeolus papilionaceus]